jgi:hypothetical protein
MIQAVNVYSVTHTSFRNLYLIYHIPIETAYLQLDIVASECVSSNLIQREYRLYGSTVIPQIHSPNNQSCEGNSVKKI